MEKNRLTRRGFLAGTAATGAIAALSLAGCGSDKPSNDNTNADTANTADDTQETSGVAQAITAAAAYSSTNYNPIGNSSALMLAATWHVFEGLYELDLHDYKTYTALAAGEPTEVSDTEYEVELRDGAKFSDGTDVTADDVVNAFEANMADATYGAFLDFIDSVEAKDDKTITFKLKYPFATLLKGRLALVKIYPKSQTEDDLQKMPIGTGPWKYDSINGDEGGRIKFVPNDQYNGDMPATCEEMEWNVLKDDTSRTTAITDGSVLAIEAVPDANADSLQSSGVTVEYVPGFALPFLMFNTKKAPFDDVRVRQAIYYAIDYDKLIANQMDGHATAATSFLPKSFANYHEASTVYTYDPEKAKSLLAEAGQETLSFELMSNDNWVKALAPQIQEDLKAVGIDATLNITTIDWAPLAEPANADDILPYDVMLTPGDPSCFGNDPDLLMTWWYGDNIWTRGRSCWAGTPEWTELQTLLQQGREESDAAKQQEIWNQCFDIIADNIPIYPLFHRSISTGWYEEKLEGFAPIATTGLVFLGTTPIE